MVHPIHLFTAVIATLFPITNPLGNAAIFVSITNGENREQRRQQALKGSIYMFLILTAFFLAGDFIMKFFGLSIEGIRIAGGLVITKIGFNLLSPSRKHTHTDEENEEAKQKADVSFSPLAMPLLAGPGAIASIMGMISLMPSHALANYLAIIAGVFVVSTICWLVLRESESLIKYLGVNGANALTRIMGFLLLCIGVQLIISGYLGIKG